MVIQDVVLQTEDAELQDVVKQDVVVRKKLFPGSGIVISAPDPANITKL